MQFTDLFIKRPVLATVISLLILALGLRSIGSLPVMQYPFTENAQITITTTYTGADPADVAAFITTPIENSVAQVTGIDYMTSSSTPGTSTIVVNLLLNYDALKALTNVNTQVNAILNQLPKNSQLPVITISVGETIDSMYIGFYSDELSINKITDYLVRVVQPRLQAVQGAQQAQILGNGQFALRAWLDPVKLAAYNLTAADVGKALSNNDFIAAAGRTDGNMIVQNLTVTTKLPNGLRASIVYDASAYVNSSIKEVILSLLEAFGIVTVVIFIFLGSVQSVMIPLIAIPLSIIGTFFIMLILGYSINLLTLLALVLGIGLVVDDAIIVVENVQRHMEEVKSPFKSAVLGARELANPIIAITAVLIAVYAPIGFMGGLTGALFTSFAFTLAGAVTVSAVIALTLSPMMCSKFLKVNSGKNAFILF